MADDMSGDLRDESGGGRSGRAGTNSIEKACAVLRVLTRRDQALRLVDVAAEAGLHKVTAFRILESLAENGLVTRLSERRLYTLAPQAAHLGAASRASRLREAAHVSLLRLSLASDDTAMLAVRSGDDVLYLDSAFGRHQVRADTSAIGRRRPLGVGAAGLSILALLPEAEAKDVLSRAPAKLERHPPVTVDWVVQALPEARRRGDARVLDLLAPGMGGIATAFRVPGAQLCAALSLVGPSARIGKRQDMLADLLREETARVEARMRAEIETAAGRI